MSRRSKHVAIIAILICAAIALLLATPQVSVAHTVSPTQCDAYGKIHRFTTGASATTAESRCNKVSRRHTLLHRCYTVSGSGMSWGTCVGTVDAALRMSDVPESWTYSYDLHELLRRESTWNKNSVNESSGACGLYQRLPCPWDYYGGTSDPGDDRVSSTSYTQSVNGFRYIVDRYGSPGAALAFHNEHGWY